MVGDSINDILAARNAAIPSIAVTFGYSDVPVVDLQPDHVIEDFSQLTAELVEHLIGLRKPSRVAAIEKAAPRPPFLPEMSKLR
jgi:phosphoglycolate phosphatase